MPARLVASLVVEQGACLEAPFEMVHPACSAAANPPVFQIIVDISRLA
jgi:hypothetical protein